MSQEIKRRLERYFDRLWPICRSITGPGYRESLDILSEIMPTERLRFETGRKVFDWTVPDEWVVRDAYLIDPYGVKRAHFKTNNLHLMNYSSPFVGTMNLDSLRAHLHSIPEQPTAIPYLTSYYHKQWGFCLTHNELESLPEGVYQVVVDTELKAGYIEVGESVLPGRSQEEILFSTYLCHPSLANNELSGPLVMAFLYEQVAKIPQCQYTYRFAIMPETIGAICYLSDRGQQLKKHLIAGYQITCVGDPGRFTYKTSRRNNTLADRAARLALRDLGHHEIIAFDPYEGSDEKQYCSPGFDLPVGSLMRTRYLKYPEYHTSLDNKDFISFDAMSGSIEAYLKIVAALEANATWLNTIRYGEPQLGKRGLYSSLGGLKTVKEKDRAMMWLLNLADGTQDLFAIAEHSGQSIELLASVAVELEKAGLIVKVDHKKALSTQEVI